MDGPVRCTPIDVGATLSSFARFSSAEPAAEAADHAPAQLCRRAGYGTWWHSCTAGLSSQLRELSRRATYRGGVRREVSVEQQC